DSHPDAHLFQVVDRALRNNAFAGGTDVQQIITAFADNVRQVGNTHRSRFPLFIVQKITPVPVQGHAGFPRLDVAAARDRLFLDAVISQAIADARIDNAIGLQLV